MKRASLVILLIVLAAAGTAAWLFGVQNAERTVMMSFNLFGLKAWQLARPVSLPQVIAGAAGAGFVLASLPLMVWIFRLKSRIRYLQRGISLDADLAK